VLGSPDTAAPRFTGSSDRRPWRRSARVGGLDGKGPAQRAGARIARAARLLRSGDWRALAPVIDMSTGGV